MPTQHLVLVPGFFGFVNFGRLIYFAHVREQLMREFARRGVAVEVHRVRTSPVASLRERARLLLEVIENEIPPEDPLHIIGHSSGGLDARLLASPGVDLGAHEVEPIARRIGTVVTLCTPHRGSPLAGHLTGLIGEPLLRVLSMLTAIVLRKGRIPGHLAFRFARALIGERLLPETPVHVVLETLEQEAAAELGRTEADDPEGKESVAEFMKEVHAEPHLIPQLNPSSCDLFNAAVHNRRGVSYGCVIARAPTPTLRSHMALGLGPYEHATHVLYRWLRKRAVPMSPEFEMVPDVKQAVMMRAAWGEVASPLDNDGMVPTNSQLHGELIHAATADHLDVIGHLHEPEHDPPHHDWIASGSNFGRRQFDAMWGAVAEWITEHSAS